MVPLIEMLLIVSAAVPLLVNVTVLAALVVLMTWFPKARLAGLSVTAGAGATPVPLNATLCGLPAALSLIETLALSLLLVLGLKVTLIVHFAPAASVLGLMGQVLV